ncbi:MAG: type II CRISPR-associated endonuclease Cas1 [Bacteroidales bacterium]
MIKRTLYFGNPGYLRKNSQQLLIEYPDKDKDSSTVPIEDIGIMILDHPQVTITQALLSSLVENNVAIINCNYQHLPEGLMLPMYGHHAFTEKVREQVNASEPLKKNLWQQTVIAKINNQSAVLKTLGLKNNNMQYWSEKVRSGDPDNYEARAAAYYWDVLFEGIPDFRRHRYGDPPNNLLNYGYAVLRAVIARSLVASGLMTFMGIHHRNKYNPYCLADDIMEPYRPYVDLVVIDILKQEDEIEELTTDIKRKLLIIPAMDITMNGQKSPLMLGAGRTSASLMRCFEKSERKIIYPKLL